MPLLHRSITELRESELVSHVLNDSHYRSTIFSIKGLRSGDARILENVDFRHFRQMWAGDVDVLVIPRDRPDETTAIQVKRFEARIRSDAHGVDELVESSPTRFRKLMIKGCKQANRTKRIGFAQVYLWIFVVLDTRERNSGWYTYEGPDSKLRSQIASAISPLGLDPTIGLIEFEWVQPMGRPPFELATHGGHIRRLAEPAAQPRELTASLQLLPSSIVSLDQTRSW